MSYWGISDLVGDETFWRFSVVRVEWLGFLRGCGVSSLLYGLAMILWCVSTWWVEGDGAFTGDRADVTAV